VSTADKHVTTNATVRALAVVETERNRQFDLLAAGKFPDYWKDGVPDFHRLAVLAEEFGEVAKEACEILHNDTKQWPGEEAPMVFAHKERVRKRLKGLLRNELVQVAAVCVAWIESLDSEVGQ